MDTMSWFGVAYYVGLFTAAYLVITAGIWIYEWMHDRDYKEGYDDGFEDGTEHGIDLTWDLSYKEGTIDGMRDGYKDGYSQAMIDMDYGQKPGTRYMKIRRVHQLDEDTIGIDLDEE